MYMTDHEIDTTALIEKYRDRVFNCMKCGACMAVCPTYKATGDESMVARGRLSLIEAALEGDLGLSGELGDRISKCIGCLACVSACPSGIEIDEIFMAARVRLAGANRRNAVYRSIARHLLGAGEDAPMRAARLLAALQHTIHGRLADLLPPYRHDRPRPSLPVFKKRTFSELESSFARPQKIRKRVAFFPGCAINLFYPSTGLALTRVLAASGIETVVPRGWSCCGLPFRHLGDADTAIRLAEDNIRLFSKLEVDTILTACPSCAYTLKVELPRLLGDKRLDVRSVSEKVADITTYLTPGKSGPGPSGSLGGVRATYHDPCHLRLGLGVTGEPREIIKRLPGVEYIEMPNPGDCCGGGGLFGLKHFELAQKIGAAMAEGIAGMGADFLVTACPGCHMQLSDILQRAGKKARPIHIIDMVAGNIGGDPV